MPTRRTVLQSLAVAGGALAASSVVAAPVPKQKAKAYTFSVQPGWRWCKKCEGLFFAQNGTNGVCPAGEGHDASGSGSYVMTIGAESGQEGWRRCTKCEGLFIKTERKSVCPAGKEHEADKAEYTMSSGDVA